MPSPPNRHEPTTATALLNTLTDSAALPALVERLEPRELKRLVDAVGLEDAGALVVHASPTQLAHLLDESIWASASPGDPETLSVPELLRWFALWRDIGDDFIAEKLVELGEDFCALAFAKLVKVTSVDLAPGAVDEFSQVVGEHLVRCNFDDEWDAVRAALVALWDDYPDFLEALFARLNFRHSVLGIRGEDDVERVLEADASHEREVRKEAAGFVGATTVGAFLRGVIDAQLDALVDERRYDADTAQYFQRQARIAEAPIGKPVGTVARADSRPTGQAAEAELDALLGELERYELRRAEHVALLAGPQPPSPAAELPIRRALATLVTKPECFEARTGELVYLANLLMADVVRDERGTRMLQADAANLAMATCNLGASYALWADARETEEHGPLDAFIDMLRSEPGLVRLFRIGWNLISQLPVQAASRLTEALSSSDAKQRLAAKTWLLDEVESLLNQPNLVQVVRAREFEQARETVKVLTIALEPVAAAALCLLIDEVPRLADILETDVLQPQSRHTVNSNARYITSMQDLRLVDRFFRQLHSQVRA